VVATAPSAAAPGRDPEPPRDDENELEHRVRELVERVVGALGIDAHVDARQRDEELLVTCTGGDLGLLIGRHGQTIDSLQYLTNSIMHREGSSTSVTIDAAGYRDRRRQTLEGIAVRAAERVAAGERVALEPMTAIERKVVHERLKDVEGVATLSEGTEPNRHIVVFPA
jgi:spoIIIJ-associated protein